MVLKEGKLQLGEVIDETSSLEVEPRFVITKEGEVALRTAEPMTKLHMVADQPMTDYTAIQSELETSDMLLETEQVHFVAPSTEEVKLSFGNELELEKAEIRYDNVAERMEIVKEDAQLRLQNERVELSLMEAATDRIKFELEKDLDAVKMEDKIRFEVAGEEALIVERNADGAEIRMGLGLEGVRPEAKFQVRTDLEKDSMIGKEKNLEVSLRNADKEFALRTDDAERFEILCLHF
jgi:hypothetical protein